VSDKLKTLTMTCEDAYRIIAVDAKRRRLSGEYSEEICRQLADIEASCLDEIKGSIPLAN
jgi:hypothetical protein